jgi:TRAP-type transport system periplasmic protein
MTLMFKRRSVLAGAGALAAASAFPLSAARAQTILRYGNAGGPQTLSNTFNAKLSDTLSERTGGELSFEIFAGSLGGEQKLIESMALGSLDMYNGAYTGTREFDIMYSPYFFRDGAHASSVLGTRIGEAASAVLQERYNSRLIGVGRLGTYNLMLKEPIESLADLRGRKIRSAQIEGCLEGLSFFGAIPTPIPFNEIYLALQNGIVDGVLTALNPGVQSKLYEVCKYVVTADFGLALDKQVISTAAWDSLSPENQEILQTTFDELEEQDYHQVGLDLKAVDLETWSDANGADSLIELDASNIASELEPLNERLANEVFGDGAWETIQSA